MHLAGASQEEIDRFTLAQGYYKEFLREAYDPERRIAGLKRVVSFLDETGNWGEIATRLVFECNDGVIEQLKYIVENFREGDRLALTASGAGLVWTLVRRGGVERP
jgi:3-oxoacyl-[acyl-carrier-protein] synthase III